MGCPRQYLKKTFFATTLFPVSKNPVVGLADSNEFSLAHGLYLLYAHTTLVNFFASQHRMQQFDCGASS